MNEHLISSLPDFDLIGLMRATESDEYGRRIACKEQRDAVVDYLMQLGLVGEVQSERSIEQGIADAQWLVETGDAVQTLAEHPFVDEATVPELGRLSGAAIDFPTESLLMINWSKLNGAHAFDSWLGRGKDGGAIVDGMLPSLYKIFDFATRSSALPSIDLQIVLRPKDTIVLAANSHRAAAAILRNETVKCDYLQVIDARN